MSVILWNRDRLKSAIGDDLIFIDDNYDYQIENVVFDNRKIIGNSLFVAKKGENNDGHNFISDVIKKTNAICLANASNFKDNHNNNSRVVLVKDTVKAMEKMAKFARDDIEGKVVGVTGSLGKTTTKELLYTCFSNYGKSFCNIQSFNNYFGVLTTLCNLPNDTKFAVIEMGMSATGEMEELSRIVRPDITIILNIAMAHIGFFEKEEFIASAKSEIFIHQKKNGFAILNRDSKYFNFLSDRAKKNNINTIYSFGEELSANNLVQMLDYTIRDDQYFAKYKINNKEETFEFQSPDKNIARNLMTFLCIANVLGLDFEKCKNSVKEFGVPRGRNNIEKASFDGKNITIINGTYNAVNPIAFISGLEVMKKLDTGNRKIAVFGDIREAGDKSEEFMLSLEKYILDAKVGILIGIGEHIKVLCDSMKDKIQVMYFTDSTQVVPLIKNLLQNNDLIFIKASKGIKTWKILDELTGYPTDIYI